MILMMIMMTPCQCGGINDDDCMSLLTTVILPPARVERGLQVAAFDTVSASSSSSSSTSSSAKSSKIDDFCDPLSDFCLRTHPF